MPGIIANWLGVALLLALAASVALPPTALAQDFRGLDTQKRDDVPAGPYTLTVEAKPLPSLQAAQFFITVADAASGGPAGDVKVRVIASLQGSDEHGYALATKVGTSDGDAPDGDAPDGDAPDGDAPDSDAPDVFTATLVIETLGIWETDLEIETPSGDTYLAEGFDFEVIGPTAKRTAARREAALIFGGVSVALLAGGVYLVWQIRRTQRQRAARDGNTSV